MPKISYVVDEDTLAAIERLKDEENRTSVSNTVDTLVKEALKAREEKGKSRGSR